MSDKRILHQDNQILQRLHEFEWAANELPIRFFGDEALRTACVSVAADEFGSKKIKEIAAALTETIIKYRAHTGTGRGLAANQLGFLKRVVVVWLGDQPETLINPKLIASLGTGSYWESCISSGSLLVGEVHRPWKGTFEYYDLNGRKHLVEADEKQTRLFLHEIDHLDGVICTERYEPGTTSFVRGGKNEILGYEFRRLT